MPIYASAKGLLKSWTQSFGQNQSLPVFQRAARVLWQAVLALGCFALLSGCDRFAPKVGKADGTTAKAHASSGRYKEAIAAYEDLLDGTAETADYHYEMGLIYLQKLKRPVDALHHFQRYDDLVDKGRYSKQLETTKSEAEELYRSKLVKGMPMSQGDAVKIRNENEKLRKDVVALQAKIKSLPTPDPKTVKAMPRKPIPPGAKTHTVQKGETLASIALKHYKSRERARDIQDANFYELEGTTVIRPGQVLILP